MESVLRHRREESALRRSLAWALIASCLLPAAVAAQRYESLPVDERARVLSGIAGICVRDPARYDSEKDKFAEYFNDYYFPAMTRYEPQHLAELGKLRYDLVNTFLQRARSEELQADLTEMAFDAMYRVVRNRNFHPAVTYNAILVLGQLDQQYAVDIGADRRPPVPLPKANELLTGFVGYSANPENRSPAPLVVGALVGLERHARYRQSLSDQQVSAMIAAVTKLLANDPVVPDVNREVAEWIRLRGAAVLANLGTPGPDGQIHQTLLDMIAGQEGRKLSLDGRCHLAGLLGSIDYEGAAVDAQATADRMLALAVEVADAEAERAKEFQDMRVSPGRMRRGGLRDGMPGGRGRQIGGRDGPEEFDRRTLLARMAELRGGLDATQPVMPEEQQQAVDTILASIEATVEAAEDQDVVDLDVVSKVRGMARQVRQAAQSGAEPPAAVDEEAVF